MGRGQGGRRGLSRGRVSGQGGERKRENGGIRSARGNGSGQRANKRPRDEDDPSNKDLYTEVDRFHIEKDKIDFADSSDPEDSDDSEQEEVVMRLSGENSDDEEDEEEEDEGEYSDNSDDSSLPELPEHVRRAAEVGAASPSDESDGEGEGLSYAQGWGKGRSVYYNADTADLEIGQDFEDAEAEEEAALELQKASYAHLDDADFGGDREGGITVDGEGRGQAGGNDEKKRKGRRAGGGDGLHRDELKTMKMDLEQIALGSEGQIERATLTRDLSKLKRIDKLSLVVSESPELPALLEDLRGSMRVLVGTVQPLLENVTGELGASEHGLEYLRTRQELLLSYCINVCFYLLLKAKGHPSKGHPVITRILALRELLGDMSPLDEALESQTDLLTRALAAGVDLAPDGGSSQGGEDEEGSDISLSSFGAFAGEDSEDSKGDMGDSGGKGMGELNEAALEEEEARFLGGAGGLGSEGTEGGSKSKNIMGARRAVAKGGVNGAATNDDFGDLEEEEGGRGAGRASVGAGGTSLLQGMVNRMLQKERTTAARRGKVLEGDLDIPVRAKDRTIRARRLAPGVEEEVDDQRNQGDQDDKGDDDDEDGDGMGSDLGGDFLGDIPTSVLAAIAGGGGKGKGKEEGRGKRDPPPGKNGGGGDRGGDGDDPLSFYEAVVEKKEDKKKAKMDKYRPAPLVAGTLEEELELERAGLGGEGGGIRKRGANYAMIKNKGLTPHKNKLNRNPRAKKREAFRKAGIRRKGQVREVRTGEADAYGGEVTGIKSKVVRSRKLKG